MLVFIIPIKSKQVAKSWKQVSELFENCLRSCCSQTSHKFRVIVVCHDKPEISFQHPFVTYIQVDFPPPSESSLTGNIMADIRPKDLDRLLKLLVGLESAKVFSPAHVMFLDADDLVSNKLAEFVEQAPNSNGWFFINGYEYFYGSNRIFKRKYFHMRCGSSFIIRLDLYRSFFKEKMPSDISQIDVYYFCHNYLESRFFERGTPLEALPFEGAIYVTDNGENIFNQTDLYLKQLLISRNFRLILKRLLALIHKFLTSKSITKKMQEEFMLPIKLS